MTPSEIEDLESGERLEVGPSSEIEGLYEIRRFDAKNKLTGAMDVDLLEAELLIGLLKLIVKEYKQKK